MFMCLLNLLIQGIRSLNIEEEVEDDSQLTLLSKNPNLVERREKSVERLYAVRFSQYAFWDFGFEKRL